MFLHGGNPLSTKMCYSCLKYTIKHRKQVDGGDLVMGQMEMGTWLDTAAVVFAGLWLQWFPPAFETWV